MGVATTVGYHSSMTPTDIFHLQNTLKTYSPQDRSQIFYRAIDDCPFSKQIWLLAMTSLSKYRSEEELQDVVEMMQEKEIHMRTFLEELVDAKDIKKMKKQRGE
eukprot:gene25387-11165_t